MVIEAVNKPRYLVFSFSAYYPTGGWGDFGGWFHDLEEAALAGTCAYGDYWHVVDTELPHPDIVRFGKCSTYT